jgi:hypothetical protein
MIATFRDEVTRARAAERAELDEGWVLLHEAKFIIFPCN